MLNNFISLTMFSTYANLRSEINRNILGVLWWIIEPLMYIGAFVLIFKYGLRITEEQYVLRLLIGLVTWKWFASSITGSPNAIRGKKGLLQNARLNPLIFPTSAVLKNLIKFLILLAILLTIFSFIGHPASLISLWLIATTAIQLMLTLSLCYTISLVTVYIPDINIIVSNVIIMLFFMSGIFFNIDNIQNEAIRQFFYLNPVALIINTNRVIILQGSAPYIGDLLYLLLFCTAAMGLSLLVYMSMRKRLSRLL